MAVIEALAGAIDVPISIDTSKADVAAAACELGATIINDVTAGTGDPAMCDVVADTGAAFILMHMQGDPRTMQDDPRYADVRLDVYDYLEERVEAATAAGIKAQNIIVDPGIGFGKTDLPVDERVEGTIAACVAAVLQGALVVRVHDVGPVARAVRVAAALRPTEPPT